MSTTGIINIYDKPTNFPEDEPYLPKKQGRIHPKKLRKHKQNESFIENSPGWIFHASRMERLRGIRNIY